MEALETNKRRTLISPKGLIDLREGMLGHITDIRTISGCKNLVPAPPHTALGETSVRALQADAERASSVGICLAN